MKNYGLFINGKWIQSKSGKTFETKNPADGQTLAVFPEGTQDDVGRAVEAAARTFPQWKRFPPPKRGEILLKAAALPFIRRDIPLEELGIRSRLDLYQIRQLHLVGDTTQGRTVKGFHGSDSHSDTLSGSPT